MKLWLYFAAALTAYLVAGWNPAITFSKLIYHQDIRTCGSKNPGFTNFKRCFGNKWAWFVLALDLLKAALVVLLFAGLFGWQLDCRQLGAAYTGLFAVLGHAYPVWYRFRGGKGYLVSLSTIWVTDWRVGLIVTLLMVVLLLTTKYMSLATVASTLCSPLLLLLFRAPPAAILLDAAMVLFVAVRHRANFKRLRSGTESKFHFSSQKRQQVS